MKDERIEQAKNKILSEMAIIILFGVAISFVVKTLAFKMDLQECITEYLIIITFPIYQYIRMHMMKISVYNKGGNKRSLKVLIVAITLLLAASAVYILNSSNNLKINNFQSPVVLLFIFLILFIAIFFTTNKYNKYRSLKYEKEFDDEK